MKRRGITTLPSLLDFRPERYGLPPFKDAITGTIPLDPVWKIKGTVVKGFGRGAWGVGQVGGPLRARDEWAERLEAGGWGV